MDLIKNISQAKTNLKNDPVENGIKYTFLVDNFMTKKNIYKLLSQFRKLNDLNWWDLKNYSHKVRQYIHYKVTKFIKKNINESSE